MKTNKMYFPCCRSKSASNENLHEDGGGGVGGTPVRVRRPNPIIVGLANHLREHHSSARNSAMAGCFGFSDSPPRYEDIYVEASRNGHGVSRRNNNHRNNHHNEDEGGICNVDGAKQIMAEEEGIAPQGTMMEDDEAPPPSYEESVGMSSATDCVVMTITIETKDNLKEEFT